jgi:protein TonB
VTEQRLGNEASRQFGHVLVTGLADEVGARDLPTLFTSKLPVRKKKSHLTATATAAGGCVILAVSAAIGGFAYDAHLNKQYQALALAAPTLAAPSPPPPPGLEEPAADQADGPITVVVNSPTQSDAREQRQNREPSQIINGSPSPPQTSSVPRKELSPSPSPVPPRVGIGPDNRVSTENQIPLGVPADVPIGPTHPAEPPPKIVRRSPGVVVGSAVKRVDPVYPTAAKESRQSGVVVVEVTISEQGSVTSTRAVSGPALLRNAAVAAARGWKFKPSTLGGIPVTTTTTIVFNFKL